MKKKVKERNMQDSTLINIRALNKRVKDLEVALKNLNKKVDWYLSF